MNSFLLSLATLLIVAILALFAAPLFIDWNGYKPEFEREASRILGRNVAVEGEIHLTVLPTPRIRVDGVKVADGDGAPLIEAKSFAARVSLTPLLGGTLQVQSVEIDRPVLRLRVGEDGSGNWRWQGAPSRVMPSDVSLEAVTIKDGAVEIAKSGGAALELQQVNGELTARALSGPFNFTGNFLRNGEQRELRISTGPMEEDGSFQLKSMLRDPARGLTYQLDGLLTGLADKPSLNGAFTARAAPERTEDQALTRTPSKDPPVEVKAIAVVDTSQAELSNLEVTLRRGAHTHNLKGSLTVGFEGKPKIGGEINARLVDLDTLLNVQPGTPPYAVLETLAGELNGLDGGLDVSDLRIAFDQASLGGDLVKDLTLRLTNGDDGVRLDALAAELPGDTTIKASGVIGAADGSPSFKGAIDLDGDNLRSLARWATASASFAPSAEAGAFSLAGDIEARAHLIALANVKGKAKGANFQGAFRYATGEKRLLDLSLASDRLDLAQFVDGPVTLQPLIALLSGEKEAGESVDKGQGGLLQLIASSEARLDLKIGTLVAPGLPPGALDAALTYSNDTIDVTRLRYTAAETLVVQADGRLERTSDTPRGKVTFALKAGNPEGVKAIATLLALPEQATPYERIVRLAPLDLQATLEAKDDTAGTAAKLTLGGILGGADLAAGGTFTGKLRELDKATMAGEATLGAPSPQIALALLFPKVSNEALSAAGPGKATLRLTLSGRPGERMAARAALDSQAARFTYEGKATLENGLVVDGHASTALNDAALAFALMGVPAGPDARGAAIGLNAELEGRDDVFTLKDVTGTVAGKQVGGDATIDLKGARPAIEVSAHAPAVSMPAAFAPLLLWDRQPANAEAGNGRAWPSQPFAFDYLKAFDLKIAIKADALRLTDDMTVQNAQVKASLEDGSLDIESIRGKLFGGELDAKAALVPRGSVAVLGTTIGLKNARLDSLTEKVSGRSLASGSFDLHAEGSGEGLSLAGIAASLTGKGEIVLRDGTIRNLSAEALRQVDAEMSEAAKTADSADQVTRLTRTLPERLTSGAFAYEAAKLPFEVRNGMMRLENVALRNDETEVFARAYLELASLKLDSEWTIGLRGASEKIPPVSLTVAGSLSEARTMTAAVETDTLERYLTMRSMEQDVERLERLDVTGKGPPDPNVDPNAPRSPDEPQSAVPETAEPPPPAVRQKQRAPRAASRQRRAPPPQPAPPSASEFLPWAPMVAPPSYRRPSARRPARPASPAPIDAFAIPPG